MKMCQELWRVLLVSQMSHYVLHRRTLVKYDIGHVSVCFLALTKTPIYLSLDVYNRESHE